MEEIGLRIALAGVGIFSILASIFNWDWFFNNRRAKIFLTVLGRGGSRVFYTILGVAIVVMAFLIKY